MYEILEQIKLIKRGIMYHVDANGNEDVFDFINKDLDELEDLVKEKEIKLI